MASSDYNSRHAEKMAELEKLCVNEMAGSPLGRRNKRLVLAVLLVVLAVAAWLALRPPVSPEKPPATLEIADLKEVSEPEQPDKQVSVFLTGTATNRTGRAVGRAVYAIAYADTDPPVLAYLVLEDMKSGEKREFRLALPMARKVPSGRAVTPYSIEWR